MMPQEPLSRIDAAWLRMEDSTHPMMITVAMVFGPPLDLERLKRAIVDRIFCIRRFRRCAVQPNQTSGRPYWEEQADVDLDYHLRSVSLRPPGDEVALRDVIGELMSTQLDFAKPLWQFHVVNGYRDGWVLVGRVHHCVADGPSLVHMLHVLVDGPGNGTWATALPGDSAGPVQRRRGDLVGQLIDLLIRDGPDVLRDPRRLLSLGRQGMGAMHSLRKLVMRPYDPATVFRGALGVAKRAAWSEPLVLEEIKAVGRLVGGTVNDVMLAACAGALRRYLQGRGEPVDGLTIRAGLSINLRTPGTGYELGNQAGAVLVELPIGVSDPIQRLVAVKREMDALKRSPEGVVVRGLLRALGQAPPETQDALVEAYCTRDTAVMANVPGPQERIYLAGAPLEALLFWVPAFGRTGLGLNVISYADQVRLSVATDRGLVPDPETIIDAFQAEFERLQCLARQREDDSAEVETSFREMSVMLDDALSTLDAMLELKEAGKRG